MTRRYLVITELFLPTKGGTAVWFDEVYRRLGGKDIHIVTAAVPGAAEHDAMHPNSVHRLDLRRVPWLRPESLAMYGKLFVRSLALALRHRFDAVHAGRALPEGLIAWLVARLSWLPVTIYAHGEELTGWGRGNKYRVMCFALRHADQVIANSDFTRQALVDMGVRPERIAIVHPGVDTGRFRPGLPSDDLRAGLGLAPDARLLLSVGRLQRRKGFDSVIRCLPELVAAGLDVHYAIVGIGEDEAYLDDLARELGVSQRVHRLGHVPMDDLPRWYNASDLFVLANREIGGDTEGFGIVFIEAAACGKAAIAGRAGGTGSAVLDGVTGLRVDGESQPALCAAILDILRDDVRRAALGAAGLARARETLSWDAVAARTLALAGGGSLPQAEGKLSEN
ncbi:glycosyltransferase family 4 protein [Azoarcus sp. KH32C]|uniref:glycosyltransferase family 4 protein n=1 Tax=Azoarcus sp. KH32C TaxID=748247 RepID=UPI0002386893|nr:glycosyltransferase family 4 protein [Azoarcus sp. KH32C]BAL25891.1 glycosyltransferase family protein [Azoarcus sp. KH32C]